MITDILKFDVNQPSGRVQIDINHSSTYYYVNSYSAPFDYNSFVDGLINRFSSAPEKLILLSFFYMTLPNMVRCGFKIIPFIAPIGEGDWSEHIVIDQRWKLFDENLEQWSPKR